ncbi:MAG: 8-oxo-dGTP diphosphatase MutT [Clostridiales bacterium]|nr:8-oxo-dGTP diphosphatase MutT [Clostridiales bacterium]
MTVDVVAALIWRGDRFFICQRPKDKARALLWEFPGGKVEAGESHEEALIRECREELAVELAVGELYMTVTHPYPDLKVKLFLYHAAILQGEPQMLEHADFRWITAHQLDDVDFCPADEEIIRQLKADYR